MSIKIICEGCGDETEYNPSALQGTNWLQEPMIGGTRVLCPKCKTTDEDYLIEREMKTLIEIHVNQARDEAVKKYTPEYVKQLRKEREEIIFPHFKQGTFIGFLLDKSKTREEPPEPEDDIPF